MTIIDGPLYAILFIAVIMSMILLAFDMIVIDSYWKILEKIFLVETMKEIIKGRIDKVDKDNKKHNKK